MITAPKPSVDIKPKTNVLLRRTNIACVVLILLGLPSTFLLGGATLTPILLFMVAVASAVINWRKGLLAGKLSAAIVTSLIIVCFVSTIGFYANGSSVPMTQGGESSDNGYSIGQSVGYSFLLPALSFPTLLGYSCSATGVGANCSQLIYVVGVVLMELVWVGGVVVGNLLVRRALKQDYAPEV